MAAPMVVGFVGRVVNTRLINTTGYIFKLVNSLHLPSSCVCCYHASPSLCKGARSARKLEKMLSKRKKKHYYDPMNVAQLGKLATGFVSGGNKVRMRSEDSIRLRTYNKILYDSIDQMMTSNMISDELEQLQLTVLGVRVAGDMSACRVYWKSTGSVAEDDRIAEILSRYKSPLRQALISHRVLGKIPPIVFLKDKASASIAEIERLLAIADFGPDEDDDEMMLDIHNEQEQFKTDEKIEFVQKTSRTRPETETAYLSQPSLFGIDHEAVNRLISANKNTETGSVGFVLDDSKFDKRFEAFMRKRKKGNRSGRKKAILYRGELDFHNSGERTGSDEMDNNDSYLDDEAFEHTSLSDEPTDR